MDLCSPFTPFLLGAAICYILLKSGIDWKQAGERVLDRYLPEKKAIPTPKEESDER